MNNYINKFMPYSLTLATLLFLVGQSAFADKRELKLLVVNQPLTYKKVAGLEGGYEFEILRSFAEDAGLNLKIQVASDKTELFKLLPSGKSDIGVGRLSDPRSKEALIYDSSPLALICAKSEDVTFTSDGRLESTNDFRLFMDAGLVSKKWLSALKKEAPKVSFRLKSQLPTTELFRLLEKNKSGCGIADRLETDYYLPFFRSLRVIKDIPPARNFYFQAQRLNSKIRKQFKEWLQKDATKEFIQELKTQYKTRFQNMSYLDTLGFFKAKRSRLPIYLSTFKKNAKRFGIPWQLVAAVSYQESHWNPNAESFTGVKGIMQLTQQTAEHLGVEDRTNPSESIWGGAKYLKMLLDRQPTDIPYRDRLALTLATYNIGPAHMIDAQDIAESTGQDPVDWDDLKDTLPLLGQRQYRHLLRYGPARGHEPVDYVQKVFNYLDLMALRL